jgi:hypothetical protein
VSSDLSYRSQRPHRAAWRRFFSNLNRSNSKAERLQRMRRFLFAGMAILSLAMNSNCLGLPSRSNRRGTLVSSTCVLIWQDKISGEACSCVIRKTGSWFKRVPGIRFYAQHRDRAPGFKTRSAEDWTIRPGSKTSLVGSRLDCAIRHRKTLKNHFNKRERCTCLRSRDCTSELSRDFFGSWQCCFAFRLNGQRR